MTASASGRRAARPRSPAAFFLLVFALSAPVQVLGLLVGSPAWAPMGLPVSALMFPVPLLAALILVYREEGGAGIRRLLARAVDHHKIRPRRWYGPALLTQPALVALAYALMLAAGVPLPEPHILLAAVPVLVVVFVVAAAAEELGWMGYAADPLQRRWGALPAALVVGAVWGAWHIVPWLQVHPPAWVCWQFVATVAARVLIFWIYNNTGGCVAAAILFHGMGNVATSLFPSNGSHYDPAFAAPAAVAAAVLVAVGWGPATLARRRGRPAH